MSSHSLYENTSSNNLNKAVVIETGSRLTSVSGGIEMNYKTIALGANVQLPVAQNFAEGQTQSKLKGLVHLTFAL